MTIASILLALLLFQSTPQSGSLTITLKEHLVLGNDESKSEEYLFGKPRGVRTDSKGNIYVSDNMALCVRVYSPEGKYLHQIGTRGEGPGELQEITGMHITPDDEVLLSDGMIMRLTRFSSTGAVLKTYSMNTDLMLWPQRMRHLDASRYIFLEKLPNVKWKGEPVPASKHLFHIFSKDLTQQHERFGRSTLLGNLSDYFVDLVAGYNPGHFWVEDATSLIYAPYLYQGRLYRLQQRKGKWEETTLHGDALTQPAYTIITDGSRPKGSRKIIEIGKAYVGIVHTESLGVFKMGNGHIVHFSLRRPQKGPVVMMEVFEAGGKLLASGPVKALPIEQTVWEESPLTFAWKDADDRFYIIDHQGFPTVKVVSITYQVER